MQRNDFCGNWHSLLEKIKYKFKGYSVCEPLTYPGKKKKNHIIHRVECFHS